MNKRISYLAAPLFTAVLVLTVFAVYGLFPFGKNTLAWCDMLQQVLPLLMDFKNILLGNSNMLLNLANAGGMSFWGVFLFFLSSPFSFLAIFVDIQDFYLLANILVLLKMMVCALSASVFFRHCFRSLTAGQITCLSVMYAFSGYTLMYFQNVVWLDMMYLFPLLLLGLYRLTEREKPALFIITFSAVLVVNFYLSYMVVVFLILAFGIYAFWGVEKERRKRVILLITVSTFLVACITAVIWLPSFLQYLGSARTVQLVDSLSEGYFFASLYTNFPVIFSTAIIIAGFFLVLFSPLRRHPKIKAALLIFILMLIPVFIEPINKMWHTGSYQAFPVRYGYITILLGLILTAVWISRLNIEEEKTLARDHMPIIATVLLCIVSAGAVGCFLLTFRYDELTVYTRTLWGNNASLINHFFFVLVLVVVFLLILKMYQYKAFRKTIFTGMLVLMVIIESIFGGSVYFGSASKTDDFYRVVTDLSGKLEDSSLYRVKNNHKYFDVNLLGGMGYNTLNHYTSLTDEDFMYSMKLLGYSSYWMEVNSSGGTPFTDFLLGNRYSVVRNYELNEDSDIAYRNDYFAIVKNMGNPSFGIVTSDAVLQTETLDNLDRFELQNELFATLFPENGTLFTKYEPIYSKNVNLISNDKNFFLTLTSGAREGKITYTVKVEGRQTLYFDCFSRLSNSLSEDIYDSFNIKVNGIEISEEYPSSSENGMLDLGTYEDETVIVQVEILQDVQCKSFGVASLNLEGLQTAMDACLRADLQQEGNQIKGTVSAAQDGQYLMVPLSYNDGYTAIVNGEEAKIHKVLNGFMAVELEEGENQIVFTFIPPGLVFGGVLSGIGLLMTVFYLFYRHHRKVQKRFLIGENIANGIFQVLWVSVFLAVYIFPIIVYLSF